MLEYTLTHNFQDPTGSADERQIDQSLTDALFERRWVGIRWSRERGPSPQLLLKSASKSERLGAWKAHHSQIDRTQVEYFFAMATLGAAVVAAYKGSAQKKTHRVVGMVRAGQPFEILEAPSGSQYQDLLCLPLSTPHVFDSARNFLGNLAPRGCTIQTCHRRAVGRLASLARGEQLPRSINGVHHRDMEWLVSNYLLREGLCDFVYTGGPSFEAIDHVGFCTDGTVVAQTTVSARPRVIGEKLSKLAEQDTAKRRLLFAPKDTAPLVERFNSEASSTIELVDIEGILTWAESHAAGRAMVDAILGEGLNPVE